MKESRRLFGAVSLIFVFILGVVSGEGTCSSEWCKNNNQPEFDLVKSFRWGCPSDLHDTECALERVEQINEWLKNNNEFRILLTGKMGTGKTTFIKGVTQNYVPEADNLLPHTLNVTPHGYNHNGIIFVFFDTPGLKDDVNASNDYSYLKEMVKKNEEPNLLIFAVKMDDHVFREEDVEAISNISDAFGWKVWKKAIFILTFANMVIKPGHSPESIDSKLHFSSVYDTHTEHIAAVLRANKVQEEVVNSIPIIPVGLVSRPKILSDRRDMSWIEEFWDKVFKVLRAPRRTYDTIEENQDMYKKYVHGRSRKLENEEVKPMEELAMKLPESIFALVTLLLASLICYFCGKCHGRRQERTRFY